MTNTDTVKKLYDAHKYSKTTNTTNTNKICRMMLTMKFILLNMSK